MTILDLITQTTVKEWLPSLSDDEATSLAREASAALRLYAPCLDPLVDSDALTLAVGAMGRILKTADVVPLGVRVEVRGPLSTTYWEKQGNLLLSSDDIAQLRSLCDAASGRTSFGGLPEGSFPPAPCSDGLFADRSRRYR